MAFFMTGKHRGLLQIRATWWPGASPADPRAKSPRWGRPTAGDGPSGTEGPRRASAPAALGRKACPLGKTLKGDGRAPTACAEAAPGSLQTRPTSVSISYLQQHEDASFPGKVLLRKRAWAPPPGAFDGFPTAPPPHAQAPHWLIRSRAGSLPLPTSHHRHFSGEFRMTKPSMHFRSGPGPKGSGCKCFRGL